MSQSGRSLQGTRGFKRASSLMQGQIRHAGEQRGFAVSRLLTHWAEIVGEDTARIARPVKVGYGKRGFGATLTVLTTVTSANTCGSLIVAATLTPWMKSSTFR